MRYISIFFLFLAVFSKNEKIQALAPPVSGINWSSGGSGMDYPSKVIEMPAGGNLILGTVGSTNGAVIGSHGSSDIWLVRTDANGNMLWQSCFGGSAMDVAGSFVALPNGHLLIAGYTASQNGDVTANHGQFDAWLLEVDATGHLVWQKTYGGSASDLLYTITLAPNGDILLGGGTYSNDGDVNGQHGNQDFWLLRTDASGNLLWQRSLGGSNHEVCYGLAVSTSGYLLACGGTNSTNGQVTGKRGAYDGWVVSLDGNGNLQWSACMGGTMSESFSALTLNGNELLLAGYTSSNDGDVHGNHGSSDGWLVRCDLNGNLIDSRCYGGSQGDALYAIALASNNQLLAAGGTLSTDGDIRRGMGLEDAWILRASRNLDLCWSMAAGGSAVERASSIAPTQDDAFLLGAYSYSTDGLLSSNQGSSDIWVSRFECRQPNASIGLSIDTTCIGMPIILTNNSTDAAATLWMADGILFSNDTNTQYTNTDPGRFNIALVSATCALTDTAEDPLVFVRLDQPLITPTGNAICDGQPVDLYIFSPGSILWNTGATGSVLPQAATGTYQATISWHGCTTTTAAFNLTERNAPHFSLGSDTTICDASSITLTGPAGMLSYLWQDGSTAASYTTNLAGSYTLTISDGYCTGTDQIDVQTRSCAMPVASFTVSSQSVCQGSAIQFSNQSQLATNFTWYFPGGQPAQSTDINPVITYTVPGVYSVMLLAENAAGTNSRMEINYITVHATPASPVITSVGNQLFSSLADNYQWLLDGSSINSATQQSHFAIQEGSYQVIVSDAAGCSAISEPFLFQSTGTFNLNDQQLQIYPNPAHEQFRVLLPEGFGDAQVIITDMTGKTMLITEIQHSEPATGSLVTLSEEMPAGAYIVSIRSQSNLQQQSNQYLIKN
jgi:PKD repeat protein